MTNPGSPNDATGHYVIRGGAEGKQRLQIIADALAPSTLELFENVGLAESMHCVDIGCGGGQITLEMARIVGPGGRALGIDMDAEKLQLAEADAAQAGLRNIQFRHLDARQLQERQAYDLAFARFLLTHLPDPDDMISRMVRAVRDDGVVVLQDIDYSGIACQPHSEAVQRHIDLYRELVRRRGGDADIGLRLPALLSAAGVRDVQVKVIQPCFLADPGKFIYGVTTESITDALVAEGLASHTELAELIAGLHEFAANPSTLLTFPRIVQTWGTVASS